MHHHRPHRRKPRHLHHHRPAPTLASASVARSKKPINH
jgi:hypothetical protein